ncbi:TIGR03032 family protein [Breoghania sp.]|uniref:TIGR03032 family protein n=1 Tax=Breoghania sp. TaxID=2065378 RepID=UPI0029C77695|nr:TIGR03032 family protein [Breoghania sp.]
MDLDNTENQVAPQPASSEEAEEKQQEPAVEYSLSGGITSLLTRLNISLAFSSYQSGYLYMLGNLPNGRPHLHQSAMQKPMGLAHDNNGGLLLTTGFQVMEFANILQPDEKINNAFDLCYMPRTVHFTGRLDAHDVAADADGRIIFVNTRYNCLATLSPKHSFEMIWKPDFISALVDEDRCHLNGLAMEDGRPAYVTAVSRSDTIDGWRDRRAAGGIVIDVRAGKIVCTGLSMPHSPRIHNGRLWILNAGTGELGIVTPAADGEETGHFEPVVFCPGFLRGLSFYNNLAFVGLSKPRYKRFEGLALDSRLEETDSEPWCGVQVIDLEKRCCVDWFRIDGAVAELFDVCVIPGFTCPMTVSPGTPDSINLITHKPLRNG